MNKTLDQRTADVALVLAGITSKTRVRLNRRGVAVDSPAEHAERLVRFFERVMNEPYCASPEHSERVLSEFTETRAHLKAVTPPEPFRVVVEVVGR
jgi:hypothetical protein